MGQTKRTIFSKCMFKWAYQFKNKQLLHTGLSRINLTKRTKPDQSRTKKSCSEN